jgi:phosphoglycolate phosphatase
VADPGSTYMIGDTSFDMAISAAAGAHPIGVSWGYHATGDLKAAGAERIVADFKDLLHLLTS